MHEQSVDLDGVGGVIVCGNEDAADEVAIDFVDVEISDFLFDIFDGALGEFLFFDGTAGKVIDAGDVGSSRWTDLLVFVSVDQGADSVIGEDFVHEAVVYVSIQNMDTRDSALDACDCIASFAHG